MGPKNIASLIICALIVHGMSSTAVSYSPSAKTQMGSSTDVQPGIFSFGHVHFRNDFPGARLNQINQINDSTFQLLIEPEDKPINKSSWYAFKIWSNKKATVCLSLAYSYGEHRYAPKMSYDGNHWEAVQNDRTTSASASYLLALSPDTIWFAAQEIITSKHVWSWCDSVATSNRHITREIIGTSVEGRPILALRIGSSEPRPVLVVLSRQHPPEVTGQLAMKAFIESLLSESEIANQFVASFSIILIPLINPDGVEHGNWRHNRNGVDLNRDWSEFLQPETRAIKNYLEKQAARGDSIVFALDFHSTKKDIFYVVTDQNTSLTSRWISSLAKALPQAAINKSFHGIESSTSKNWIYKRFGAEAVTYEVGDETDRVFLKHLGTVAAECLLRELLSTSLTSKR